MLIICLFFGWSASLIADDHHYRHYNHNNRHYGYHHNHSNNNWWIAPAIIGGIGAITYGLSQNPVPQQFHYETVWDYNCACYRQVLVPN